MKPLSPRPADWIDRAPVRIDVERSIAAPAADVWTHIADHERWPTWMKTLKKVEIVGQGEGVGGGRRVFLPGAVIEEEFTEWVPGEVFAFTLIGMNRRPFRAMSERVRLRPDGDRRTVVTYTQGIDPYPRTAPLVRLVAVGMRRGLRDGLDQLAALAERRA